VRCAAGGGICAMHAMRRNVTCAVVRTDNTTVGKPLKLPAYGAIQIRLLLLLFFFIFSLFYTTGCKDPPGLKTKNAKIKVS